MLQEYHRLFEKEAAEINWASKSWKGEDMQFTIFRIRVTLERVNDHTAPQENKPLYADLNAQERIVAFRHENAMKHPTAPRCRPDCTYCVNESTKGGS